MGKTQEIPFQSRATDQSTALELLPWSPLIFLEAWLTWRGLPPECFPDQELAVGGSVGVEGFCKAGRVYAIAERILMRGLGLRGTGSEVVLGGAGALCERVCGILSATHDRQSKAPARRAARVELEEELP